MISCAAMRNGSRPRQPPGLARRSRRWSPDSRARLLLSQQAPITRQVPGAHGATVAYCLPLSELARIHCPDGAGSPVLYPLAPAANVPADRATPPGPRPVGPAPGSRGSVSATASAWWHLTYFGLLEPGTGLGRNSHTTLGDRWSPTAMSAGYLKATPLSEGAQRADAAQQKGTAARENGPGSLGEGERGRMIRGRRPAEAKSDRKFAWLYSPAS
jgi:hypothetical protein